MARYRLPNLKGDTEVLFNLYYENNAVKARDIKEIFGCSEGTACRVVICAYDYARENGIHIYAPPTSRLVPVDLLFKMYGWDIQAITRKYKILAKVRGKENENLNVAKT